MVNFFRCLLAALFVFAWLLAERGYADSTRPPSPEYDACVAHANGVTAEMLRCANSELERQTTRLNRTIRVIMDSARISIHRKRELASEQKKWETSRNKDCLAAAQREASGGSIASVIARDCVVSKTAERAEQLEVIGRE